MKAIFYDLETSDKNFTGQILNYSFILVNEKLEVEDELSGLVRLSRLQLPTAGAILANRVNVRKHQQEAGDTEAQAMRRIFNFFSEVTAREKYKVLLIGYNSSRFDLPYLRTSLIRNGFSPYFGGRLAYRDLLFGVRKLSVTRRDFPRSARVNAAGDERQLLSLSLETVTRQLGLLEGRQAHSSRDDVLLTINLARRLRQQFGFDILGYEAYEAGAFHLKDSRPVVVWAATPQYDLSRPETKNLVPFALHEFDNRQALWIDLTKYQSGRGRESVSCLSYNANQLMVDGTGQVDDPALLALAAQAKREFCAVNIANFYPCTTCDIEQHIYRLPLKDLDALSQSIHGVNAQARFSARDANVLYVRYKLANYSGPDEERYFKTLQSYALYRYGGRMQLAKTLPGPEKALDEERSSEYPLYHPTFEALLAELEKDLDAAEGEDAELLKDLKDYYLASEIKKALGAPVRSNKPSVLAQSSGA